LQLLHVIAKYPFMKFIFLLVVAAMATMLQVRAQPKSTLPASLHAIPMLYSPTQAGASGGIRVAADDRRFRIKNFFQNGYTTTPAYLDWQYSLTSVAADMPLLQKLVPKKDILGIGVVAQYGRNDQGMLEKRTIGNWGLSAAYHRRVGKHGSNYLSAGLRYMHYEYNIKSDLLPGVYERTNSKAASIAWHSSPTDKFSYFVAVTGQKELYKSYWGEARKPLLGDGRKHYQTNLMAGMSIALSNTTWVCVNGYYYPPNSFVIENMAINGYARVQVAQSSNQPLFVYGGGQYMRMRQATGIGPSAGVSWGNVRLNTAYEIVTAYNPGVRFRSGAFETSLVYVARSKTKPYNRLHQTFL
jgi:hypothetical protein